MSGLDIQSLPFYREVGAVTSNQVVKPCRNYDLEFLVNGESYKPLAITGVTKINDFILAYYGVYAIEFHTSAAIREKLIENSESIEAVLKVYEIGRNTPYMLSSLKNPVIRRYKAKLYLEESDYISQNNPANNNHSYMSDKSIVEVKVQLVEKGFEQLKSRHVGATFRWQAGHTILKHLVDYHANLNNDDVNSMINGVDVAPNYNLETKEQICIPQGVSLVEAMHMVNIESGGLYPTGFSYFIHRNTWYIFPPYSLARFNENVKKLLIVNLPKNRLPGLENTYSDTPNLLTVLSTREVTVKDKRESKKVSMGTGLRFGDLKRLMQGVTETFGNRLAVDASKNVNDVIITERQDGVQQIRFADNKLTASKNIELSKLAPTKGFMMRISWENSDIDLVYPGMPVKVLYLKNNKPQSVVGVVVGTESADYPVEEAFPPRKFSEMSFIHVFVGEDNLNKATTSNNSTASSVFNF